MNPKKILAVARLICVTLLFLAFSSCSRIPGSSVAARQAQRDKALFLVDSFKSEALSGNALKQNPVRPITIILPPSYYAEPARRYPVVYYLHGYKDTPGTIGVSKNYVLKLMAAGIIPNMIIVEPDCMTKYGGGFYANSPMNGAYEDYLTSELIAFIDANYRTIPVAAARGLSGYSMGGFGALAQGLKHPDRFGVVFAIEPVVLVPGGLNAAWHDWAQDHDFLFAYASAFSPDVSGKNPGKIPTLDGTADDNALCALWYAGVGDWDRKIAAYSALPAKLEPDEFEVMMTHTTIGYNAILAAERSLGAYSSFLSIARDMAWAHHEKWDGSGYPRGLSGERIPLAGRLMAIPDVYDALISARVYKQALTHEESVEIIRRGMGVHFDPDITLAFLDIAEWFRDIALSFGDAP